jgi:hypothetical protein
MKKTIIKLLGITESKTPKATREQLAKPLAIVPFDGGIVINGYHRAEDDDTDDIIVGLQGAPADNEQGWADNQNCVVSNISGALEKHEPDAEALLRELAYMLDYKLVKKSQVGG